MTLALALAALLHAAAPGPSPTTEALANVRAAAADRGLVLAALPAPALADALEDPPVAHVGIHLPRRESECLARTAECWLVLYLCGFDSSPESFAQSLTPALDALDHRPDAPPLVVVVLDGRTRLGGGWYVDSHAEGAWQSFVLETLLPAARDALAPGTPPARTLLMGHSMGGFGALHLAATQPHRFAAVAAFNPVVRPGVAADEILGKMEATAQHPDAEARLKDGAAGHFGERILLSMGGAFLDDPRAPHGLAPLLNAAQHPWRLNVDATKAFAAHDLTLHPEPLRRLARIEVYAGRNDRLIPLADLQALERAVNKGGPSARRLHLVQTDGDHLSHLASDLSQALTDLAR